MNIYYICVILLYNLFICEFDVMKLHKLSAHPPPIMKMAPPVLIIGFV